MRELMTGYWRRLPSRLGWALHPRRIAAFLLVAISLRMTLQPVASPQRWRIDTTSPPYVYSEEFQCLRGRLPAGTRIGYWEPMDNNGADEVMRYFLVNFALAPTAIAHTSSLEWTVVYTQERGAGLQAIDRFFTGGYVIQVDCKNGVFLVRTGGPP